VVAGVVVQPDQREEVRVLHARWILGAGLPVEEVGTNNQLCPEERSLSRGAEDKEGHCLGGTAQDTCESARRSAVKGAEDDYAVPPGLGQFCWAHPWGGRRRYHCEREDEQNAQGRDHAQST